MSLKKKTEQPTKNYSLGEASTVYLISLPAEERARSQPELTKFIRWYGEKRAISELTAPQVENYTEQLTATITELSEKINPIKDFLSFSYKKGFVSSKLAHLLKVRKTAAKNSFNYRQLDQNEINLTSEGYADLGQQLTDLISQRPIIAEEIRKAAADKDFRENAPLESAREQLGRVEGKIKELDSILKSAKILNDTKIIGHGAMLGDRVILQDLSTGEILNYLLVDMKEANPSVGKISVNSPIGRALIGHKVNEKIEVNAPVGILPYLIKEIRQS